jgi:phenylalanyl-tRNA synthetase beta chain
VRQKVLTDFALDLNIGVIELDIERLKQFANLQHLFKPWSVFPQIIRDFSFFVNEKVKFSELKKEIEKLKINYLQEIILIDIYFKEEKSMTLRFVFAHPERSLTDQEVNNEMNKIENYLKEKFRATIR